MKHALIGTEQLVWDSFGKSGWQPAIIQDVFTCSDEFDMIATVEFRHSHRLSRGHYLTNMNRHEGCAGFPGLAAHGPTTPPTEPPGAELR